MRTLVVKYVAELECHVTAITACCTVRVWAPIQNRIPVLIISNMTYHSRLTVNLYIKFCCLNDELCSYFEVYELYKFLVLYQKIATQC